MAAQQAEANMDTGRRFPRYAFIGDHREIGRQYGESCRQLIERHLELAINRLRERTTVDPQVALDRALRYRSFVQCHAPAFDDEIQGVAEGAGLTLAEAYLLQLRAEAATGVVDPSGDDQQECTTFAVLADATDNGTPLIGQNADLPAFYGEISVVAEIRADGQPAILMLLPAGQVSYIGINDRGMGAFANYVTCDGWRYGFPRYLLSRLALTEATVDAGIARVRGVPRASSRNLIMLDAHGSAADLETTPTRDARLDPEDGLLAHSNHYVASSLLEEERSPDRHLANSRVRLERMRELLRQHRGQLNAGMMQEILRDRACHPDSLCRCIGDDESDIVTFASVIAEPSEGRMWVAVGPPDENDYHCYSLSA